MKEYAEDDINERERRTSDTDGRHADGRRMEREISTDQKPATPGRSGQDRARLFPQGDSERFRSRWSDIQTNFVDEPRRSVEQANELVAEITERITSVFNENRSELERQWTAGDEVSTEDLRKTLQQYRSFFERLLSL